MHVLYSSKLYRYGLQLLNPRLRLWVIFLMWVDFIFLVYDIIIIMIIIIIIIIMVLWQMLIKALSFCFYY
jgi:hypothetical protein